MRCGLDPIAKPLVESVRIRSSDMGSERDSGETPLFGPFLGGIHQASAEARSPCTFFDHKCLDDDRWYLL